MFIIDATFEDIRIRATSDDGTSGFTMQSYDNHSGKHSPAVFVTPQQLTDILAINLHSDGTPVGYEEMYKTLEPLFLSWDNTIRPIP